MDSMVTTDEGTTTRTVAGREVVASYGNDAAARAAYAGGAVLVDRSHWGLIRLGGSTRLAFMHNQSTANFKRARAGETVETVVLTSTARIVDWVTDARHGGGAVAAHLAGAAHGAAELVPAVPLF